jgi:hypothetical protein
MPKDPVNTQIDFDKIDPKAHRRVLRLINAANSPEDLLVAPNDRRVVDEEQEHIDFEEHAPDQKQILAPDQAAAIIEARDRVSPVQGFAHLKDAIAVNPALAGLLQKLLPCFGPASYGRWDLLYPIAPGGTPFALEHAALMHTYKVVFLADGTDTAVWDPSDETTPLISRLNAATTGLAANVVCCGNTFLSNGQLLAVGGGGLGPGNPTSIQGWKFDPETQKWARTAGDMATRRWYPTAVTLGDESGPDSGRVLIGAGNAGGPVMEIYSEATDSFSSVTVDGAISHAFPQNYPALNLLPGGEVFYTPTGFGDCSSASVFGLSDPSAYFSFSGPDEGSWTNVGSGMNRTKGMAALLLQTTYPFVRVFVAGGGDSATSKTVSTVNLSTFSPAWGPNVSIPDGRERVNVDVVLLPDGNVFMLGGLQTPPLTCYRYNPSTAVGAWAEMDELHRPRHYHSAALLLPSGKVMAAGGAAPGGCTVSVENTIEVFSPPYLFNPDGTPAARPSIKTVNGVAPTTTVAPVINHGSPFNIETPDAGYIAKVVLVRPMVITHNTDTEQRVIQCNFTRAGDYMICAVAPDGLPPAMAPRGYYMLFILNAAGVPSEGKFVRLF